MKKIIVSLIAVGFGFTAQAANRVWNGGTDANFNTTANWTGGTIAGQTAVFTNLGSFATLNNDITDLTLAGMTFTTNAYAYTINGNPITLGGTITLSAGVTNPQVITLPMTLNAARAATVKDGATLTLGGPISGDFGFTKSTGAGNGGTLILTGTNTFTGDLTLGTGINKVSSDENTGAGTNINSVQNAKLTTTATFATSKTITLSSNGANQDINPDAGTTLTLNGAITGGNTGATMRLGGAGKIILAASNDYGATTTIISDVTLSGAGTIGTNNLTLNSGIFNLGGKSQTVGALAFIGTSSLLTNGNITTTGIRVENTSGNANIAANLHGTGAALTKTNNGTVTLSGSNTYSGGTLIISGILQADSGGALGYGNVTNNATLVFAPPVNISVTNVISGSGVLVKSGADDVTLWGDNTFSGGVSNTAGAIKIAHVNALGSGTLFINGGALSSGANIRDGNGGKGVTNNVVLMKNLSWNTGTSKTQLSGQISGTNSLNLNGFVSGELTLSGDNSAFSGGINVNGANIIYAGHANAFGTGTVTFNKDNGLRTTIDLSGGAGVANNFVLSSPTNSLTVLLTNNLTLSGVISGSGFMIKSGASTLKLTGTNTFSNGTTVSNGTLIAGADGALGSGNVTVAGGATLTLTNGALNDYINDAAGLILSSNSILNLDYTGTADIIGAVSLDGGATWLTDGTYNAAALASAGGLGTYNGTGSLMVGSETPNGTPYSWLDQYGLTNYVADDVLDQDTDGLLTWQEYIAGTNPTNATSVLKVTQNPRNTVIWTAQSNRIYSVHWSTNLVKGFTNLPGASNLVSGSWTNTTPDTKVNHYQVRVRLP